jgi:hypothetical protein
MAKTPASDIFSTLKTYFNQLSDGERTPTEVASALNGWARESAESIKAKIAEEVEATVSKMGFIKQDEYDLLLRRVEKLEKNAASRTRPKTSTKAPTRKPVAKIVKKKTTKKVSK